MQQVRRRLDVTTWLVAPVAAVTALACDATMRDDSCGSQAAGVVHVASWWGNQPSSAEARALEGLTEDFSHCNRQATAEVNDYTDKAALMQTLDALLATPSPVTLESLPDVIQLNAGDTALPYASLLTQFKNPSWDSERWLSPDVGVVPEKTANQNRLADGAVWFEPVKAPSSVRYGHNQPWMYEDRARWVLPYISINEGHSYHVVPIAIHHVNRLYYNIERARDWLPKPDSNVRFGGSRYVRESEPVKTDLALFTLADWLERLETTNSDNNTGASPILFALPNDDASGWALNLLAAENVKIAFNLEKEVQTDQPRSPSDTSEYVAKAVMDRMETIRRVSQAATSDERWSVQRAMDAVESGEAMFTVMGDWSYPDLNKDGERVGMIPFPGTKHVRVYTIDGFAAVNKSNNTLGRAWLRMVTDPGVASRFAATKGAIGITDWLEREVKECASTAYNESLEDVASGTTAHGEDCWVIPAMSMRGQACDAGNHLLEWVRSPTSDNRRRVEAELAKCSMNAAGDQ